jgi:hypothetical protein
MAFNKWIWEAEDQVEPKNAGVVEFLTGMNIAAHRVIAVVILEQVKGFQPVCWRRWVNGNLEMVTTNRLLNRLRQARPMIRITALQIRSDVESLPSMRSCSSTAPVVKGAEISLPESSDPSKDSPPNVHFARDTN